MCVALCKIYDAVDRSADCRLSFLHHLLNTRSRRRCTAGCSFFAPSSLRCCAARLGGGIVALPNVVLLPPSGEPVGAALVAAEISCILWCGLLPHRRFSVWGFFLALHFGFSLEFAGITASGNIMDISNRFFTLVQCLHTDIIFLILVDFPVYRRPGSIGSVHLAFLRFAQTAQFVRGQLCLSKTQMLSLFCRLVCIRFQLFPFGQGLLNTRFLRGRACLFG